MSTRSIVHIHDAFEDDEQEGTVCSFYGHYYGQPEGPHGMGYHLKKWLKNKKIVYGRTDSKNEFNMMEKLAVFLPAAMDETHSCYMIPTGDYGRDEEYTYHVFHRNGQFEITVNGETLE